MSSKLPLTSSSAAPAADGAATRARAASAEAAAERRKACFKGSIPKTGKGDPAQQFPRRMKYAHGRLRTWLAASRHGQAGNEKGGRIAATAPSWLSGGYGRFTRPRFPPAWLTGPRRFPGR